VNIIHFDIVQPSLNSVLQHPDVLLKYTDLL
jgi:hypothetical protein